MPFIGSEFPKRTRKGSSKYEKDIQNILKRPGQVYEFEGDFEAPGTTAGALRSNKYVQELAEDNNGTFEFMSAGGKVYGKFTPNGRSKKIRTKKRK